MCRCGSEGSTCPARAAISPLRVTRSRVKEPLLNTVVTWATSDIMTPALVKLRYVAILVTLTLSLVATGFAHRVPTASDSLVQSYLLAGGELADLCAGDNGDGMPDRGDCLVCHIAAVAELPDAGMAVLDADLAFVAKVVAPRESRALRPVLDPARGMRAPPLA
jgi:hypothetical protein